MNPRTARTPVSSRSAMCLAAAAASVAALGAVPSAHADAAFPGSPSGPGSRPFSFAFTLDCGTFTVAAETGGYVRDSERTGPDGTVTTRSVYLLETTFTGPTGAVVEGRRRGAIVLAVAPDGTAVLRENALLIRKPDGAPTLVSLAGRWTTIFAADGAVTVVREPAKARDVSPEICAALAP